MKFKVGDKVRVTREGLKKQADQSFVKSYEVSWWTIKKIAGDVIYCPNNEYRYEEKYLELVPEEPEFAEGEWVEVSNDGKNWEKSLFVHKLSRYSDCPYICVREWNEPEFKEGFSFDTKTWKYAHKPRPQLTRKEIAEKFGVGEDFTLID